MSDDLNFRLFASNLEQTLDQYEVLSGDDLLERQRQQFEQLWALETEFRETLIKSRHGSSTYRTFMNFIVDKNILTSRPYFRERQTVCNAEVSVALKNRNHQALYRFKCNYNFVAFVMASREWPRRGKLAQLAKAIEFIREEIVQMNLPLAISQARLFWERAPQRTGDVRYTYMDFVQIASDGLISAVDKFVPPFSRVWRAVAIGRMKGNFIRTFSETTVHFYELDRRKIYRANKAIHKFQKGAVDFEALAAEVNIDPKTGKVVPVKYQTNAAEIADLMAAAAWMTSLDQPDDVNTESGVDSSLMDRYHAPDAYRPDVRMEEAEVRHKVQQAMQRLTPLEAKLLKMRGVNF